MQAEKLMVDILTTDQCRLNMSRIRSLDSRPEMIIRPRLLALGFRHRLQDRLLPACPDLVFPRYRGHLRERMFFARAQSCFVQNSRYAVEFL